MRVFKYFIFLGFLLIVNQVNAEDGEFSIGIAVIDPNGVTAKYWTSDIIAIDIFGEWSFDSNEYKMHVDVLKHDYDKIQWEGERVALYYGIGVRVKTEEDKDTRIGVRVPIGVAYYPSETSVELFGEVGPRLNVYPSTNVGMDLMVGARYRFL